MGEQPGFLGMEEWILLYGEADRAGRKHICQYQAGMQTSQEVQPL